MLRLIVALTITVGLSIAVAGPLVNYYGWVAFIIGPCVGWFMGNGIGATIMSRGGRYERS